ncbi:hypothetical protein J3A83DRAFT_4260391 [Scleroderma citrinum]
MDGTRLIYPRLAALRARGGVDLLPNLCSIICFLSDPGLGKEKLLPSSLRVLTSFVTGYSADLEGHTNTLLQLAHTPLLERFNLRGFNLHELFRSLVVDHIQPLKLAYLREVDLTRASISSHDFQFLCVALCESPVTTLSIHLKHPFLDWQPVLPVFPVLHRLTFCGDPSIARDFLERLSGSTLADFTIEHEDSRICLSAYESLLGLLHERFSDSLESVHLNFGRHPIDVLATHFLLCTLVALLPLVKAGLKELRYSMPVYLPSLPEEIRQALEPSSWPTLRVFSFSTQSPRLSHRDLEENLMLRGPAIQSFRMIPVGPSSSFGGTDSDE